MQSEPGAAVPRPSIFADSAAPFAGASIAARGFAPPGLVLRSLARQLASRAALVLSGVARVAFQHIRNSPIDTVITIVREVQLIFRRRGEETSPR
jgi:hypothetical protein